MKKVLHVLGTALLIVVGVPVLIVLCLGYLLYVPFDIIRYRRTPYYKDLGAKYEFFVSSRDIVKLYNRTVREKLPIQYFNHEGFEYFVKDGQVLLCGWGYDGFEQADEEWFLVFDGECETKMAMQETLENEIELIKPEHQSLPAKFLIFYNDITDAKRFEQAKLCPYFYCVFSVDDI